MAFQSLSNTDLISSMSIPPFQLHHRRHDKVQLEQRKPQ